MDRGAGGSSASAIWVNRPAWLDAIVFVAIDGESLKGAGVPKSSGGPRAEARRPVAGLLSLRVCQRSKAANGHANESATIETRTFHAGRGEPSDEDPSTA